MVGALMVKSITRVPWDDLTESFPAFHHGECPSLIASPTGSLLGSSPTQPKLSGRDVISWLMYAWALRHAVLLLFSGLKIPLDISAR